VTGTNALRDAAGRIFTTFCAAARADTLIALPGAACAGRTPPLHP